MNQLICENKNPLEQDSQEEFSQIPSCSLSTNGNHQITWCYVTAFVRYFIQVPAFGQFIS